MALHATDRNLLFGILAVQLDFVSGDTLVNAMHAWALRKETPLGQILVEQGALTGHRRALLEALVQEHLAAHGNDAAQSLARLTPSTPPEVQATLSTLRSRLPDFVPPTRAGIDDPRERSSEAVAWPEGEGRFEILRHHASGGLGDVFLAHDRQLHRAVALKQIQPRHADDPDRRARFLREAEITGRLEHPGIVPVYALGQGPNGRPFYAMRFIEGDSLQQAIERFHHAGPDPEQRPTELRQLLRRFVDVCNAIAYAHSKGVIHRDLKPANVMLGPFGETLVVDWGLAKAIGRPEESPVGDTLRLAAAAATQLGATVGTLAYMSPEQAVGRLDELGPASDTYSLGATLYHLLTGRAPFTGAGAEETLRRVCRGDFPRPRQVNALVPPPLESVCLKAMARKADERYPSPRALADDLEHWLADEPVAAYKDATAGWLHWGPYVGDRAWATVREDYSGNGDAWNYLPHDLARSKAYRWGEDGIAGFSDRAQRLCLAAAFWNGKDPILKERLFGLTPSDGNHGEDVKEYYFHLDATPTHSYMKFLYKYPQYEFPYARLVEENRRRDGTRPEFELLDTGIFDDDRYFDIFIEYAKEDPEDVVLRIEAFNRGPEVAPLHVLPHLWFRNTWGWTTAAWRGAVPEPVIRPGATGSGFVSLIADDTGQPAGERLGKRTLYAPAGGELLFTDNETNGPRVHGPGSPSRKPHVKDAFHRHVVLGEDCLNPARAGTKAALHYRFDVPPGQSVTLLLRLSDKGGLTDPLGAAPALVAQRRAEADGFYGALHPPGATADERRVQRQALAGLLWTKQCYLFDVETWLEGDSPDWPPPQSRKHIRNHHWRHLRSAHVLTVPDKWEYPWFCAWDLAFQCVALALVDPLSAKEHLWVLLSEQFQHSSGQLPGYEWEFSESHPPVFAWAVWRVYERDRQRNGRGDRPFLERCFHKLQANFGWWINKLDAQGTNVFGGGYLGFDNIAVLDRSEPLPGGAVLEQADATCWVGMFCLDLIRIALELGRDNPVYEGLAVTFFRYFTAVARALKHMGGHGYPLWDEEDGFFYDVLRHPDGSFHQFRVRSLVGLVALFAVDCLDAGRLAPFKEFTAQLAQHREGVVRAVQGPGNAVYVLAAVDESRTARLIRRLWDESEFLSPHGIRSLSKVHERQPFRFAGKTIAYEPGETAARIKGGNCNWRGPVWLPTCFLLIEALGKLSRIHGPAVAKMARQLADRLIGIFTADEHGRRPVHGSIRQFQFDPHWRDYLLFYESFHGETGAGLGASHQTGWTALVACLIDEWRRSS